ncbi:MAG: GPR endopeptidase [Lachnospiraceae bacterium]|nr:GPR endopeptidase [Lachnospiraceae bacterium]
MEGCRVRTDLALEARESLEHAGEKMQGIRVEEYRYKRSDVQVTKVYVETKNAAGKLGKPVGTYVTMEAEALAEQDEGYHREISRCLARELQKLMELEDGKSVLVIGLGNRAVTADSLGPQVLDHLYVTRHIAKLYGKAALGEEDIHRISCIEPGVMAKTGMETSEILAGVIRETNPDIALVIDALAARSIKRLNRTIQITDTGIQPGSGVGNHRNALSRETLGIPVIAVGIPTVVDAATIVGDALERDIGAEKVFRKERFGDLNNLYMTGKDVDEVIRRVSYTVSEGINMALKRRGAAGAEA